MELRMILYGYEKRQFEYFVNESEAAIVKRIYAEYLSGKTLLQIGNDLSTDGIAYYKDKSIWSKQAVRRILENKCYLGDGQYPKIIDKETFQAAMELRMNKSGGERKKDNPEVHYLKYHTKCLQCGGRFTRRRHYSRSSEGWVCTNGCKNSGSLKDSTLYGTIIKLINIVIEHPQLLVVEHKTGDIYMPTVKVRRDERTLNDMMRQEAIRFQTAKKAFAELLSEQFDCCRMDYSYAVTDALIEYVGNLTPIERIDAALLKVILKEVQINAGKKISLRFINDAVIEDSERIEN